MILEYSKEVLELVHNKKWLDAANLLRLEWLSHRSDLDAILQYGCALWYLLTYDYTYVELSKDRMTTQFLHLALEGELSSVAEAGFLNHKDDLRFQAVFGWIILIKPFYFFTIGIGNEYDDVKKIGMQMIKSAHDTAPHDPFYQAVYYATTDDCVAYRNARDQVASMWETYFEDDDFAGSYFLAVFSSIFEAE